MGLTAAAEPWPGWTREAPAEGLVCWQPKVGYRYGVEAYALASFAVGPGVGEGMTALDLGAGSGIVALANAGMADPTVPTPMVVMTRAAAVAILVFVKLRVLRTCIPPLSVWCLGFTEVPPTATC